MESNTIMEVASANEVKPKMKFTGTVSKIGLAGAIIDIGIERPAVLHISQISSNVQEPLKRVEDVLQPGQQIEVWVRKIKADHIELTMIKPLDLEWREIKSGMVVKGKVTRLEKFGAFVEIGAERPGLVHISELAHGYVRTPSEVVKEGDEIEAQVLEVNRRKKQIKLSLKALQPEPEAAVVETKIETTEEAPPRSKGRKKTTRKSRSKGEHLEDLTLMENIQTEPEPTVMEMAWQAAMEKAKARKQEERNKKNRASTQEQEEIFSRTLEQKQREN